LGAVKDVSGASSERGALPASVPSVSGIGGLPGSIERLTPTDAELARARSIVLEHGWNATAYQILNPGISLWFSSGGEGVIGYVKRRHTLVVAGAPVCPLSALSTIAGEFVEYAHSRALRVCYFGAGDRLESAYAARTSWSRVLLGAQPSWDPRGWPSAVAKRPSLRGQFNRARNKGVTVSEWPSGRAESHPDLCRILEEWLSTRRLPPLHFLVEPQTLSRLADRRVFVAERGAHAVAFTVLSPVSARDGWLVEQIVRGHDAPNGTAELLIDTAMRAAGDSGSEYVTLGLSPLSRHAAVESASQPLWLRFVLEWVRLHGARFYNFGGLEAFKAKFNPEIWEPIYAIAEGRSFPPAALYAIAGAFSGGAPLRLVALALFRAARDEFAGAARRLTRRVAGNRQRGHREPRS
jgi:phosphatidylglycerol lysyltransferase